MPARGSIVSALRQEKREEAAGTGQEWQTNRMSRAGRQQALYEFGVNMKRRGYLYLYLYTSSPIGGSSSCVEREDERR